MPRHPRRRSAGRGERRAAPERHAAPERLQKVLARALSDARAEPAEEQDCPPRQMLAASDGESG